MTGICVAGGPAKFFQHSNEWLEQEFSRRFPEPFALSHTGVQGNGVVPHGGTGADTFVHKLPKGSQYTAVLRRQVLHADAAEAVLIQGSPQGSLINTISEPRFAMEKLPELCQGQTVGGRGVQGSAPGANLIPIALPQVQ